ncbi:MAG: FHA domain-containing protein [Oscillospiraceae bacterium]|nr:FHA domain-containing protein [Oscillospiraceae bacterium]
MTNQKPVLRSQAPQHRDSVVSIGKNAAILGRTQDCSLIYRDGTPGVSGRHCAVVWDADTEEFIVEDLNSSYGTFLEDGTRLEAKKGYRVRPGTVIWLGDRANRVLLDTELGEMPRSEEMKSEEIPSYEEPEPEKKKSVLPIILVLCLLLALAAVAVWYFVLRDTGTTGNGDGTGTEVNETVETEDDTTAGENVDAGDGTEVAENGEADEVETPEPEIAAPEEETPEEVPDEETKTYLDAQGEQVTEVYDSTGKLIHKEEPYYVDGIRKGTLVYDAEIKCDPTDERYSNESGWSLPVFKPQTALNGALSYTINLTYYKLSEEELGEQIIYQRTDGVFHSLPDTLDVQELRRTYGVDISFDKPTKVNGFATRSYRSPRSGSFSMTINLTDVRYVITGSAVR